MLSQFKHPFNSWFSLYHVHDTNLDMSMSQNVKSITCSVTIIKATVFIVKITWFAIMPLTFKVEMGWDFILLWDLKKNCSPKKRELIIKKLILPTFTEDLKWNLAQAGHQKHQTLWFSLALHPKIKMSNLHHIWFERCRKDEDSFTEA